MKKLIALFMVAVLCLSLCACSSNKIKSIVLSENSIDITVGDSYSLSVIVLPEDSDEAITWQSANEDIATVDDSGTVRSVSVGITSIVVSSQSGISSNCTVNVIDKSAYDKLNDNEKAFVDTFVRKAIGYFKAPDSVSIRKIDEYEGDASTGGAFWMIELSSTNSFGGTDVGTYFLSMNGTKFVDGGDFSVLFPDDYDCDLITVAIQEKR